MQVVLVAMEDVLENIDNLFVDNEGLNLLVDVEEILERLLNVQELGTVLVVVGKVPDSTRKYSCKVCDSFYKTKVK